MGIPLVWWIVAAVLLAVLLRRLGLVVLVVVAVLVWWFWPVVSLWFLGAMPWSLLIGWLFHLHVSWS